MDYAQIFEASLNEIYIFDASTLKFIEVNQGARQNLGYTIDELCQMTPLDLKKEYTAERFNLLTSPLKTKTSEKIEFVTTHQRKDGTFYPVEVHLQLMEQDGHDVFVAIILDITKQERLGKTTAEMGYIFQHSLNEIYVFHRESLKYIEVNTGARKNLGYTLEELRQMTPLDVKPTITPTLFQELTAPLLDGSRELVIFDSLHKRKNGTTYPVEVHLQCSTYIENPVFVGIVLDQTEKKRLAERNKNLGDIFERSLNEIYTFDAKSFQFWEANFGARENLGYTLDEMRQMTPLDIIVDMSVEKFLQLIAPLQEELSDMITFEAEYQRKDKTSYPTEVHLQLMRLDNNPVFIAIVLDITERIQTNQQLVKLTLANQQAHLVKNFIKDTSHEFRSSLAILNTKSYLLSRYADESLQRHTTVIQQHVERLDTLVSGLQETAVLQSTEEISSVPVNINNIIHFILDEQQHLMGKKQLSYHLNLAPSLPPIFGDEPMIRTALYNIFKNACEYNIDYGSITITSEVDSDLVVITIEDTGIGIEDEHLDKIFDLLYRVDQARSLSGGNGLGLTIAKRIIQLHDGEITVGSTPNYGTIFVIALPAEYIPLN